MDVVACNAAVLLPHAFTGKAGSMEVAKARGTVDVAGGSSHIIASLAGKVDRREAKCGAAVKCKPILMLVAVAEAWEQVTANGFCSLLHSIKKVSIMSQPH